MILQRQLHDTLSCQSMGRNGRFQYKLEMINGEEDDHNSVMMMYDYDDDGSIALDDAMESASNHSTGSYFLTGPHSHATLLGGGSHDDCFDLDNSEEWDDLLLSEAYHYQPSNNNDDTLHDLLEHTEKDGMDFGIDTSNHKKQPPLRELLKQTSSRRLLMDSARQSSSRRMLFANKRQFSSRRLLLQSSDRSSSQSLSLSSAHQLSSRSLLLDLCEHEEEEPQEDSLLSASSAHLPSRQMLTTTSLTRQGSSSRRLMLTRQSSSSRRKLFSSAKQSSSRRYLLKRQVSSHRMLTKPR